MLHGAKTGMATTIVARYYDQIARMSRDEANTRLARWAQAVDRSRGWHIES